MLAPRDKDNTLDRPGGTMRLLFAGAAVLSPAVGYLLTDREAEGPGGSAADWRRFLRRRDVSRFVGINAA